MRSSRLVLVAVLVLAASGCRSAGSFVWVDAYREPQARSDPAYVITPGDVLSVRVFGQDGLSGRSRVREDGNISLPFVNDVGAAGLTPVALAGRLKAKFSEFINNPMVTVALEEPGQMQVSVVGEVVRPGLYRVDRGAGLLAAIATAGGLTTFADRDRIFVLRKTADGRSGVTRVRFTWDLLVRGSSRAATFHLLDGDSLVIE